MIPELESRRYSGQAETQFMPQNEPQSEFEKIATAVCAKHFAYSVGDPIPISTVCKRGEEPSGYEGGFCDELPNIVIGEDGESPVGWYLPSDFEKRTFTIDDLRQLENCPMLGDDMDFIESETAAKPRVSSQVSKNPAPSDVSSSSSEEGVAIRDRMKKLASEDIISPDTTFLQCAELIAKDSKRLLVVMEDKKPVGIVQFRDLFSSLGRLCLLRLTFDLEVAATQLLCAQDWTRIDSILSRQEFKKFVKPGFKDFKQRFFSDERTFKHKLRYLDDGLKEEQMVKLWIASISIAGKNMIIRDENLTITTAVAETDPERGSVIDRIFKGMKELRNCCAHPTGFEDDRWSWTPDPEIDEENFGSLFTEIRWLTDAIREQTQWERTVQIGSAKS